MSDKTPTDARQALERALWPHGNAPKMAGDEFSRTHVELIVSRVLTLLAPPVHPQFCEAFHVAQTARTAAEKRLYLTEQKLDAARRSNGMLAEQVQAARDDADGLRAELDDKSTTLAIVSTALDEAAKRIAELEQKLASANEAIDDWAPLTSLRDARIAELERAIASGMDTFRELPEGSPMADAVKPRCECAGCSR